MLRQILPLACLALAACSPGDKGATGDSQTKSYDLKDFTSVKVTAGIDLKLAQGPFAVSASSKNRDLSKLKIEVHGDELSIASQSHFNIGGSSYSVSVTAPTYKAINASAGVVMQGDNLKLDDVSLDLSAGVDARLSGACKALTAKLSAGAVLKAEELKCASATVDGSAGAVAEVFASDSAKLSAAAGAKVSVDGHPPRVDKNVEVGGVVDVKD